MKLKIFYILTDLLKVMHITLIALLLVLSVNLFAAKKIIVGIEKLTVDAIQLGVEPGDTMMLEAGKRKSLRISNVKGDSLHYVIISNQNGDVIIENDDFHYGFALSNCSFFRLTGSISNKNEYGIRILKTGKGANGLGIGELSTNYEVDHVEIANTGFSGIFALSQPTCDLSANRGFFEQRNTIFHDNYIHDTYGEGMYIGHSFYTGYTLTCDGESKLTFPHEIKGLKVYNNILKNNGYDGIQICSAVENTEVYNNSIYNYGTKYEAMQHSGIQIGAGTKIKCYNNQIINGTGTGIMMFGLADSQIFNNLIVNAGKDFYPNDATMRIHGIFVDDRLTYPNTSHLIANNTIISPKSDGIRFISTLSTKNLIANNLIVKPGATYIYEPGNNRFINCKEGADVQLSANFYTDYINEGMNSDSINSIYKCLESLPISRKGIDLRARGVDFDFYNKPRLDTPTIGAFEYISKIKIYSNKKSDIVFSQDNLTGTIMVENKNTENLNQVMIVDLTGKNVFNAVINEPRFIMFNIKGLLPKGIYLLSVERSNEVFTYKFVISEV